MGERFKTKFGIANALFPVSNLTCCTTRYEIPFFSRITLFVYLIVDCLLIGLICILMSFFSLFDDSFPIESGP